MSATTTSFPFDTAAMQHEADAVEAFLAKAVAARPLPANLRAATQYALLGGGKRLRPMLVLRCCRAVGGSVEQAMPAAGAIELIHTFSLVHDDLPAMDDDDLRRGRPTLHKATNEAMAILAGDLMSSFAFELVATHLPLAVAGPVMLELAVATNDMIAGQVYDTLPDFDPATPPMERLRTVHRNKTGALIRCSCRMGAICGNADAAQLDALTRYGEAIGLMFQVVDDLLDVTQTTEHLGKTAGKDAVQGKLTYPGLIGLDASRREVERLRREALEAIKGFGPAGRQLRELVEMMATRTK